MADSVTVKSGFARNFLIPQKLAVYDTPYNRFKYDSIKEAAIKEATEHRQATETRAVQDENEMKRLAETLSALSLKLVRGANADGVTYGSVRKSDVAELLNEEFGIELNDTQLIFEDDVDTITRIGTFNVDVKSDGGEPIGSFKVEVLNQASS